MEVRPGTGKELATEFVGAEEPPLPEPAAGSLNVLIRADRRSFAMRTGAPVTCRGIPIGLIRAKLINYGYNEGISILGGWVNEKASLSFTTPLVAGNDYLFLAGGDNDTQDVELEILDDRNNVVAADVRVAPDAVVAYTPQVGGNYTLRMTLFKSNQRVPCVCVTTVLRKNGWKVPVNNLDQATVKIMKGLDADDQTAQRLTGERVDLRRVNNQWAFFGGVLRQGQNMAVNKMSLGFGDCLFVGAGDNNANVINLDLEDANGKAIKQDLKNNPVSVLEFRANGGTNGLRVHNV